MKTLMLTLVLVVSNLAHAGQPPPAQEAYRDSCTRAKIKIFKAQYPNASSDKIVDRAMTVCNDLLNRIVNADKWKLVKDPTVDGCYDATRDAFIPGSDENVIMMTELKICGKQLADSIKKTAKN